VAPRERVGPASELLPGEPKLVYLGYDDRGFPRQAIVMRDPWTGEPRAWLNLCKHLPIPLDGGSGDVLGDDGKHFICRTHGAIYRADHGYCIEGPCEGQRLDKLRLEEDEDGVLWVSDLG